MCATIDKVDSGAGGCNIDSNLYIDHALDTVKTEFNEYIPLVYRATIIQSLSS